MTSAIDPHHRFQRQIAIQVGVCWIVVLGAAVWAWRISITAESPVSSLRSTKVVTSATATSAINPAAWNVNLWQPFGEGAALAAVPTTSMALKLYSILQQGDGPTAAIAVGDTPGLVYVKAGDTCNGATVVRVEAGGVVLRVNGQEQWLGLGQ